jgi:membrane-bound lytic murein transglycosylase B
MRNCTRHAVSRSVLSVFVALPLLVRAAPSLDVTRDEVSGFVAQMAERHGFDRTALETVFAQVEPKSSIVEAMSRPAEKRLTWTEYRALFITDRRISRGVEIRRQQPDALRRAAVEGVPAPVLLAIVGVETSYGENTGRHRVIDALSTLAFDYPPRSEFFREELEQYLLMTREESLDPLQPRGSYAGAMGIPQFMPSSFREYAVDGDGDGRRDLWDSWSDVLASVANYLRTHGWRVGEPIMAGADVSGANLEGLSSDRLALTETVGSLRNRGVRFATDLPPEAPAVLVSLAGADGPQFRVGFSNYYAITRYNRSALYASAVNDLAEAIAATTTPTNGFSLTVTR